MRGHVRVNAWSRGQLLWTREADNLVVADMTTAVAKLLGNDASPYYIAAVGFGDGTGAVAKTDTALGGTAAYYRAIDAVSYPSVSAGSPAQIQVDWSINADAIADYGANGIAVAEMGLFANPTAVTLPASVGNAALAAWADAHAYSVGDTILDSNNNVQECTTAGTSGGSAPSWSSTIAATTTDNAATWTCRALHTAPTLLLARVLIGLGTMTPSVSFTSTWTITV